MRILLLTFILISIPIRADDRVPLLVGLDDSFESQVIKAELTRDWRDDKINARLATVHDYFNIKFLSGPELWKKTAIKTPAAKVGSSEWREINPRWIACSGRALEYFEFEYRVYRFINLLPQYTRYSKLTQDLEREFNAPRLKKIEEIKGNRPEPYVTFLKKNIPALYTPEEIAELTRLRFYIHTDEYKENLSIFFSKRIGWKFDIELRPVPPEMPSWMLPDEIPVRIADIFEKDYF